MKVYVLIGNRDYETTAVEGVFLKEQRAIDAAKEGMEDSGWDDMGYCEVDTDDPENVGDERTVWRREYSSGITVKL